MEEYIENSELPDRIEQKYDWSCTICNIKEALNYMLRTNISEEDILSRIDHIVVSEKYMKIIKNDVPEIKLIEIDAPYWLEYSGLERVARSFCKGSQVNFAGHTFPELPKIPTRKKGEIIVIRPQPRFEVAITNEADNERKYQIIREMLQDKGVITASGDREAINNLEHGFHSFTIKGIGKENGQRLAKILDSNYKRRNLEPEYFVPLQNLSTELVFYKQ